MAALAGCLVLDPGAARPEPELVQRLCAMQGHRGTDPVRVVAAGEALLGASRLPVTDPSPAASQPMAEDGLDGLVVCLDGLIVNHAALRTELEAAGQVFRTRSDTEVVLRAFAAWGEACLDRLDGMFALVVLDRRRRRLLLVRDAYALKPLHYCVRNGVLYWSSEIKPLLEVLDHRRLDFRALLEFALYCYTMPPATLFAGVHSLAAGEVVEVQDGRLAARPAYRSLGSYVDRGRYEELGRQPVERVLDEIDRVLAESVRGWSGGETELGVALSGGVDSAVVAALAQRSGVRTAVHLSVPEDPRLDERQTAEAIARHVGIGIEVIVMSGPEYRRRLARTTWANEVPLWHMQCVGFDLLYERAQALGLRGLLTGEGVGGPLGVEGGRHTSTSWLVPSLATLRLLPGSVGRGLQRLATAEIGAPVGSPAFSYGLDLTLNAVDGMARRELMAEAMVAYAFVRNPRQRAIHAIKLADLLQWQPILSQKQDRLGMARGLEYRSPFRDLPSVRLGASLPLGLNMRRGTVKWALKEVACRYMPREIAFRKKVAFDLPAAKYIAPLARIEFLRGGFCQEAFAIGGRSLQGLLDDPARNFATIFKLVHIEVWGRLFIHGRSVAEVEAWIAGFEPGAQAAVA